MATKVFIPKRLVQEVPFDTTPTLGENPPVLAIPEGTVDVTESVASTLAAAISEEDAIALISKGTHDYGNILWVSPTGNNATAERGNFNAPYRHPKAAVDAASEFDTVVIMPGTYTFGTTLGAPGADWTSSVNGGCTLVKPNLHIHMMPGAILRGLGPDTSNQVATPFNGLPLINLTGQVYFRVTGSGQIIYDELGDSTPAAMAFTGSVWNPALRLTLDFELDFMDGCKSLDFSSNRVGEVINIKVKRQTNSQRFCWFFGGKGDGASRCVDSRVTIEFDDVNRVPVNLADGVFVGWNWTQNSTIDVDVKNGYFEVVARRVFLSSEHSSSLPNNINGRCNYKIGNAHVIHPHQKLGVFTTFAPNPTLAHTSSVITETSPAYVNCIARISHSNVGAPDNAVYNFDIGNLTGHIAAAVFWSGESSSVVNIRVASIVTLNNHPAVATVLGFGTALIPHRAALTIQVPHAESNGSALHMPANRPTFGARNSVTLKGCKFVTTGASFPTVVHGDSPFSEVQFHDCIFINDRVTAPLKPVFELGGTTSPTVRNIILLGTSYSNGGAIGANVNPIVGTFVASTNVR